MSAVVKKNNKKKISMAYECHSKKKNLKNNNSIKKKLAA